MKQLLILMILAVTVQLFGGNWIFGESIGGPDMERIWDIQSDSESNLFITGEFVSDLLIGEQSINGMGLSDTFVAKYDCDGGLKWCNALCSLSDTAGLGVGTDADGNCYVGGYFMGTMFCQGDSVVSNGLWDAYVAKFDPEGTLLWLRSFGSPMNDIVHGLCVNAAGDVFAGGWFAETMDCGDGSSLTSYGGSDTFVIAMNQSGDTLWARQGGSPGVSYGYKVACDNAGNSYLTGVAGAGAVFGNFSLPGGMFVTKYDAQGNEIWALPTSNAMVISISCMTDTAEGQQGMVAGRLTGNGSFGEFSFATVAGSSDYYWARFDAESGTWLDLQVHGGSGDDRGRDCSFDNGPAVVGTISENTIFMGENLNSAGGDDIVIYDPGLGIIQEGGEYSEVPYAICHMPNGCLAIAGWHFGSFMLDSGPLNSGNEANQNGFMAIYSPANAAEDEVQSPPILKCYPNPFTEQITVKGSRANKLKVYNMKGQLVRAIDRVDKDSFVWDGRDTHGGHLSPGIYLIRSGGQLSRVIKLAN